MMLTKENTRKARQLNQFCLEKQQLETKLDSLKDDWVNFLAIVLHAGLGLFESRKGFIQPLPSPWSNILLCSQPFRLILPSGKG